MLPTHKTTKLAEGITLFSGIDHECCIYLIEGKSSALLIDTGFGTSDLRGEVEAYTKLPYKVVNTHGHGDHSGGNFQFDEVFMAEAALPDANAALELNRTGLPPEEVERIERISALRQCRISFLHDGDIIDLGGREVEAVSIPGHTPGCIAFFDRESGLVFSGDCMVRAMPILLIVPQALSMSTFVQSIERLSSLPGLRGFCSGHDECIMPLSFIRDTLSCAKSILDGTAQSREVETGLPDGEPTCLTASCGDSVIFYRSWNVK